MGKIGQTMVAISIVLLIVILIAGCGSGVGQSQNKFDRAYQICRQLPDGDDVSIGRLVTTIQSAQDNGYDDLEVLRVALDSCNQTCGGQPCATTCNQCMAAIIDAVYH